MVSVEKEIILSVCMYSNGMFNMVVKREAWPKKDKKGKWSCS